MPDTFEGAPTPFVAFLSVAPKAAGFAMLMRVFSTAFGDFEKEWALLLAGIAALTMTVGNLAAIPQRNFKRLLAYSSIAQAGYMLVGLAAYNMQHKAEMGWMREAGILIYLVTYVFMNVGAFGVAILVSRATGSDDIEATRWMVKRSPLAAVAFLLFGWSLAGLPPTAGFIGKYFLFSAAVDSGLTWLALVGVLNSVVSVFYYFNIVRLMFFPPPLPGERMAAPAEPPPIASPRLLEAALALSIIGTLAIGIYPQPIIEWAQNSILNVPTAPSVTELLPLLKW
jgi:proton-translocating NADH-quinone oxidoreductase chain N